MVEGEQSARKAEKMNIVLRQTDRGFLRGAFTDLYHSSCSIQESSLATERAIWLGCNEGVHHHVTGACMARMHLSREMAAALWPMLKHFAETGELKETEE